MDEISSTPRLPAPETLQIGRLQAVVRASRELSSESDPIQSLWRLVCALREDLTVDRVGVFAYDRYTQRLERIVGVDLRGEPEYEGESIPVTDTDRPLMHVALRRRPHYLSNHVREEFPNLNFRAGFTSLGIVPIVAGDELLGTLCLDNSFTQQPFSEAILEPLYLYAGLAALPLFALYQKRESERIEKVRKRLLSDVLFSVTNGRIRFCDHPEIDREWPSLCDPEPIENEMDIPRLRAMARNLAAECGMDADRARDFELCASEAATNALVHGKGGYAVLDCRNDRLRIRVCDRGRGIDPEDLPKATLQAGWSKHCSAEGLPELDGFGKVKRMSAGLGFTLINKMADQIFLSTGREGTTIIIEMAVKPELEIPAGYDDLWDEVAAL